MHSIRVIDFKDCQEIAERLGEGKTVVINMEDVKNPAAQRIMDFVSGAVYAYNGTLSAVSQKVFIAAPLQVPVEGDFIDDIMNGDLLSPEMSE